jgi:hypothetical protein
MVRLGAATLWTAALCIQPSLSAGRGTAVYELRDSYMPQGFFSKWDFWTDADPSNGAVQYLSREAAAAAGMLKEEADHAYFGVDMARQVEQGAGRPSVRIQSKAAYNSGLFVAKINHAPTGCGTWPAFWLYGEDPLHPWPTWGEYDVAESINNMKRPMTTLHTSERCTQEGVTAGSDFLSEWEKGTENNRADNCDVKTPGQWENQGCSQKGPMNSWGQPFNAQGGGTYAAEWDPDAEHIRTWFWPAGMEPSDLTGHLPMPETWGTPFSYFSLKKGTCDSNHFKNMRLVFTLNMCGDLADPYFGDACPALAKQMSCQEMAEQHPEQLSEAYWSVASLDVYQRPHGALLPFIFFNDAGHGNSPRPAVGSSLLTALGAVAAVMGLAGVSLVVRAEMGRVYIRDDEESRRLAAEDISGARRAGSKNQSYLNVEAVSSMFHNGRRPDSAASINSATPLTANPEFFNRQPTEQSQGGRSRGFSWASTLSSEVSAAVSVPALVETAPERVRGNSWDSAGTVPEGEAPGRQVSSGPRWGL